MYRRSTRNTRVGLVLGAALVLLGSAPVTARQAPQTVVLRISPTSPSDGKPPPPTKTPFATMAGAPYSITVSLAYSFDGRAGLSDCGHQDPSTPTSWRSQSNLDLDGVPARCVTMPFAESHTYQWHQRGTGAPFVFQVPSGSTYTEDDTGYLLAVITRE